MSNSESVQIIVNGAFCSDWEPSVPVRSRGLMYGDGCFETFCAYRGRFFKLNEHLQRLGEGLEYLDIKYPADLVRNNITVLLEKLLRKNSLQDSKAIIRIQVWREGGRGYATSSNESGYSMIVSAHHDTKPSYRLATVSIPRIPTAALPSQFKFTNGINYIQAAQLAGEKGADDALMATLDGYISETTIANIFWLKNDTVYTPSIDCDILPGITRRIILQLLTEEMGVPVEEGKFKVEEVKKGDAVWVCNSVMEIAGVRRIDETIFDASLPFIEGLQSVFQSYRKSRLSGEV